MNEDIPLPALRRDLRFTPHMHGNRVWYAVEDPESGRFARLGRDEYLAATEMNGRRSAADIVKRVKDHDPESTLNAAAVIALSQ